MTGLAAGLVEHLRDAFAGDPEAVAEVFTGDAVLVDTVGEPPRRGLDDIEDHFLEYGGRRSVFELHGTFGVGATLALRWTLHFRADAAAYAHHGWARIELRHGRIARWDGLWVEAASDLEVWGGD